MKRGFSVLEVLIAIAILTIVVGFGCSVYREATCKKGHYEVDHDTLVCIGFENYKECKPQKTFVCEDE